MQWRRCVQQTEAGLSSLAERRWLTVNYETFVDRPEAELGRVAAWLGVAPGPGAIERAVAGVSSGSVGKGRARLDVETVDRLKPIVEETQT